MKPFSTTVKKFPDESIPLLSAAHRSLSATELSPKIQDYKSPRWVLHNGSSWPYAETSRPLSRTTVDLFSLSLDLEPDNLKKALQCIRSVYQTQAIYQSTLGFRVIQCSGTLLDTDSIEENSAVFYSLSPLAPDTETPDKNVWIHFLLNLWQALQRAHIQFNHYPRHPSNTSTLRKIPIAWPEKEEQLDSPFGVLFHHPNTDWGFEIHYLLNNGISLMLLHDQISLQIQKLRPIQKSLDREILPRWEAQASEPDITLIENDNGLEETKIDDSPLEPEQDFDLSTLIELAQQLSAAVPRHCCFSLKQILQLLQSPEAEVLKSYLIIRAEISTQIKQSQLDQEKLISFLAQQALKIANGYLISRKPACLQSPSKQAIVKTLTKTLFQGSPHPDFNLKNWVLKQWYPQAFRALNTPRFRMSFFTPEITTSAKLAQQIASLFWTPLTGHESSLPTGGRDRPI